MELVEEAEMDRCTKRFLTTRLKAAGRRFDKGQFERGTRSLQMFQRWVDRKSSKGRIQEEDAQAFKQCAEKVMASVAAQQN